MEKINNYKKIQIILLISIIIALIVFVMLFIKGKQKSETSKLKVAEVTAPIEEVHQNDDIGNNDVNQNEEEIENPEDTSWDEDAEDTKVENPEEEEIKSKETYYLKVNYTANVVTAYKKDKYGKYTVPVKAMICSTGKATPKSGTYKMSNKYRWHQLNGGVYGQYCSRITGHILFHSVPYAKNTPDSLKYTAYDKLGTSASAGCVRLTVADALWIYNNCPSGTYVEFYSSENPGPLGKPSAQKIASNEQCRNWDPTDPLSSNPWKNYTEQASAPIEETVEKVQEDKNNNQTNSNNNNNNDNKKQEENTTNNTVDNTVTNNTINNTVTNNTINNNINNNTIDNTNNNTNTNISTNTNITDQNL